MIPPKKSRVFEWWFRSYACAYLRRSFHRVLLLGELPSQPPGPVLVCVNHTSWWDLLLGYHLCSSVLSWDGYTLMDERQLTRYRLLTRIGVMGVDRESLDGARDALDACKLLLAGTRRSLWLTGQGAMVATDARPVRLYSGIARLAQALAPCTVLTATFDYEFWNEKLPEAFVSFGLPRAVPSLPSADRRLFIAELERELEAQLDALAAARKTRNPALFHTLLQGSGSLSPVYDAARRVSAAIRGTRHRAEHGAVATPPRWGPARPRGR